MAENFVAAVKAHMERLARFQAETTSPDEIVDAAVEAAAEALYPVILSTVKENNVELVRVLRNNPTLLRKDA